MLPTIEDQYHTLLNYISKDGHEISNDRTGTGTKKDFGHFMKFEVDPLSFPILTSKKVHWHSIVVELLWMLNGDDNTDYLKKHNVTIWDEWADDDGSLNGVYGKQWRSYKQNTDSHRVTKNWNDLLLEYKTGESIRNAGWRLLKINVDKTSSYYRWKENEIDQVSNLIDTIKNNPDDRRQLVTAWNVAELDDMNLPPCHHTWQTFVRGDTLDLMMHQRSCDMFLGVPFNLTAYSLLLCILAKLTGLRPGIFNWTGGDCHIYSNHYDQVAQQLDNYYTNQTQPGGAIKYPYLEFDSEIDFTSLQTFLDTTLDNPERIALKGYENMGTIKAPVAI